MTYTPITTKVHQSLDVHRDFTAKVTFNSEFCNSCTNRIDLIFTQLLYLNLLLNSGFLADIGCSSAANTVDGSQCDNSMFTIRYVDSCNSSHLLLS